MTLLEKTDMLLGLVMWAVLCAITAGLLRPKRALGADELFAITDKCARHKCRLPATAMQVYDVLKVEQGPGAKRSGDRHETISRQLTSTWTEQVDKECCSSDGAIIEGDAYKTTGSTGPMGNCLTYGNGAYVLFTRPSSTSG